MHGRKGAKNLTFVCTVFSQSVRQHFIKVRGKTKVSSFFSRYEVSGGMQDVSFSFSPKISSAVVKFCSLLFGAPFEVPLVDWNPVLSWRRLTKPETSRQLGYGPILLFRAIIVINMCVCNTTNPKIFKILKILNFGAKMSSMVHAPVPAQEFVACIHLELMLIVPIVGYCTEKSKSLLRFNLK